MVILQNTTDSQEFSVMRKSAMEQASDCNATLKLESKYYNLLDASDVALAT